MGVKVLTESTIEPVSLDDFKQHMRISTASTVQDSILSACLKTARVQAENMTDRAFVSKTCSLMLDGFPSGSIRFPIYPISSVSSDITVLYTPSTDGSTTLSSTGYTVDLYSEPNIMVPSYGNDWPDTLDIINAVEVRFVCGHSTSREECPEEAKTWIKMRAGALFSNRESLADSRFQVGEIPRSHLDGLLDNLKVHL